MTLKYLKSLKIKFQQKIKQWNFKNH